MEKAFRIAYNQNSNETIFSENTFAEDFSFETNAKARCSKAKNATN